MRTAGLIILFLLISTLFTSCKSKSDKQPIEDAWNEYIFSLLAKDGNKVVSLVDKETIRYYEGLSHAIRFEDSATIKKRYLVEQLIILKMRLTVPRDSLMSMGGEDLLRRSVGSDLFGKGMHKNAISRIVLKGHRAKALVVTDTSKNISFPMEFVKEDGKWKLSLVPFMMAMYPMIQQFIHEQIKATPFTENAYISYCLADYDSTYTDKMWQPVLINR